MGGNAVQTQSDLMRRASAAMAAGRVEEAVGFFRDATRGGNAAAYSKLALALVTLGRFDEGVDAAQSATEAEPNSAELLNNLGNALLMAGRSADAIDCYRRALALRRDYAEAKINLAHALTTAGNFQEAIPLLEEVVAAQPDLVAALVNLGNAYQDKGDLDKAIATFENVVRLRPDFAQGHSNLALALKDAARLDEAVRETRGALGLQPNPKIASSLLILLQYHPGYPKAALADAQREWFAQYIKGRIVERSQHENDPSPDRRLRVGYVSPDFRHHPVGHNILPLLEQHDHTEF